MSSPSGDSCGVAAWRAGSSSIGVSVAAGETTLTVTPEATTSAAQLRASAISAALLAAYRLRPAFPCATRLPTRTTRPSRRPAMAGITIFAMRVTASTCRRHIGSKSCALSSPSRPTRRIPAACTSADAPCAAHAAVSVAAPSVRSTRTAANRGCSMRGGLTSKPFTCQSSASKRSATARPMPELAPVTTARRSFDTDVPLGDDLARERHVFALKAHEVVDRPGREDESLLLELRTHVAGQGLVDLGIQALCDLGRELGWTPQPVPAVELVAGHRLGYGRHVGHARQTRLRGHRDHPQPPRLGVRGGAEDWIDERVDLPAEQILVGGRGALVRHDDVIDPARPSQQLGRQMTGGSRRTDRESHLARVGLGVRDQALDVGDGQVL